MNTNREDPDQTVIIHRLRGLSLFLHFLLDLSNHNKKRDKFRNKNKWHRTNNHDETKLDIIWAAMWENVPSDMCSKQRLEPACASAQSDRSLRCPQEETLHPWLSKTRPVKIQIRLRECAGWSESSLGAHVQRYVFWRCGSLEQLSWGNVQVVEMMILLISGEFETPDRNATPITSSKYNQRSCYEKRAYTAIAQPTCTSAKFYQGLCCFLMYSAVSEDSWVQYQCGYMWSRSQGLHKQAARMCRQLADLSFRWVHMP